ncbi:MULTISPECIES: hypothetical protein [Pandoraea]|uniref:hypothetical protein n=1 Tax=Pandoraea TaxID=93217 RepID=UPI001F5C3C9E|nr:MULTISPECIES: hypothetical protein [Pandoraea]MCI3206675.1 hypothetical protein [Pandoraea sp. LA3]MDN4584703.1 hypothetical protein [Pandoraea capi]
MAKQDRWRGDRRLRCLLAAGIAAFALSACRGSHLPVAKHRNDDDDVIDLLDGKVLETYRQSLCAADFDDEVALRLHPP